MVEHSKHMFDQRLVKKCLDIKNLLSSVHVHFGRTLYLSKL